VTGLRIGFGLPVSGSWATPANLATIARQAEELAFDSLWTFQRLLHPAEGDWGATYRAVQDPLTTLAYVAAITERVRLGVAVVNAPFYSPIVLAKQLTTLDQLAAGRLDVGLGLGWAAEEFAAVGVGQQRRGARLAEFVRCLQEIWAEDPVRFSGEFYQVPDALVRPKPVQRPHPPILLGGGAAQALRRAGRLADGWISASRHDLRHIGADIAVIKEAAVAAGRDADRLRFIVRAVIRPTDEPDDRPDRRPLHGSIPQLRADLLELAAQGVTEAFIDLNFDPAVGSPDADPQRSMSYASTILAEFAPGRMALES
jgi:probable F420-dependent oxidoreductase